MTNTESPVVGKCYGLSDEAIKTLSDADVAALLMLARDAFDAFGRADMVFEQHWARELGARLTRTQIHRTTAHESQLVLAGVA